MRSHTAGVSMTPVYHKATKSEKTGLAAGAVAMYVMIARENKQ